MHITKWSASRSGAAMRLRGTNFLDGSAVAIAVKLIEFRGDVVVAIDRSGSEHTLQAR